MYRSHFEDFLSKNKIPNSVIFYGEYQYFYDYYTDKILQTISGEKSILKLYFEEYDFNLSKNHISEQSLFGDINILIIKTDKKIDKKELEILVDITIKNGGSFFILHYLCDDWRTKTKIFNKDLCCDVRFFKPKMNEAVSILDKISKIELNLDIERSALEYLLTSHALNIATALGDLQKISYYEKTIKVKDVISLVSGQKESNLFLMIENLVNKREFFNDLALLFNEEDSEVKIINQITSSFFQLFQFCSCARINGNTDSKEFLGYKLPIEIEDQRAKIAIKLKPNQYLKILQELQKCEYRLKCTPHCEKKSEIVSSLIKVQEILQ